MNLPKVKNKKIKSGSFMNNGGITDSIKGQSSIEFVLVIPLLIIVILIVSQLGYIVYLQNTMEQAAREGTRILSTTNSNSKAVSQVFKICKSLDAENINIEISPHSPSNRVVGDTVRVKVLYRYGGIADFLNIITGKAFVIKSSSIMRMESN